MTDETRPEEGRTPSSEEPTQQQERPEFRPAQDGGWGDPSGRSGDTAILGSPSGSSYGDPGPGYGDAGSSYGDSRPGYGDSGPSYGDSRPGYGAAPGYGGVPGGGVPGGGVPSGGQSAMPGSMPGGMPGSMSGPLPPPPQRALGMGPGWAPPPPAHTGASASGRGAPATGVLVALAVIISLVAGGIGSVGTYLLTRDSSGTDPSYTLGPIPTGATSRPPESIAGVAARVLPSVVSLEVGNGTRTEGATGSGFLIKGGYIVTNNHVVEMAASGGEIKILYNNRQTTGGRIVGRDPGSDLAVVKPEQTFGTPEIPLGNSDQIVVGDTVIAIGSPLGLTGTVTTGIVSSLNRPVVAGQESARQPEDVAYISAIQTDAAINPGNSGGPLVNVNGEVVGVNSAIATLGRSASAEGGNIGLGFAIPSNQARRVAEELIKYGKAKKPRIGIVLDPEYNGQGVRIATTPEQGRQPVEAGGPAAKAGLKPGDVILEVDGLRLQNSEELIALIRSKTPGSKITIKYQRDGQEKTATLTVMGEEDPAASPSPS